MTFLAFRLDLLTRRKLFFQRKSKDDLLVIKYDVGSPNLIWRVMMVEGEGEREKEKVIDMKVGDKKKVREKREKESQREERKS